MKKTFLSIIAVGIINFSCLAQETKSEIEIEVEKWTKELIDDGKIFNCNDEVNQSEDFILNKMTSSESDLNSDGIKDGLFYYHYNTCGGNGNFSDLAMFIYSKDGQLIIDKNFTKTVEKEIKNSLSKMKISNIERVSVKFKGIGQSVVGEFSAWVDGDLQSWPSNNGYFEYDTQFTFFDIKIFK